MVLIHYFNWISEELHLINMYGNNSRSSWDPLGPYGRFTIPWGFPEPLWTFVWCSWRDCVVLPLSQGYGGGFNERENVEYIEREESDGEYDEVREGQGSLWRHLLCFLRIKNEIHNVYIHLCGVSLSPRQAFLQKFLVANWHPIVLLFPLGQDLIYKTDDYLFSYRSVIKNRVGDYQK